MQGIIVGRYTNPVTLENWLGWIEPEDHSWIVFIEASGRPLLFDKRDAETGAVL